MAVLGVAACLDAGDDANAHPQIDAALGASDHGRDGGGVLVSPFHAARPATIVAADASDLATASPDANAQGDGGVDAHADAAVPGPPIAIAKWFDNHTAAISLNLDGWIDDSPGVMELVKEHGLALDCELVTGALTPELIDEIQNQLLPNGITFFGHGSVHENHDEMTYEEALASATQCFDRMQQIGLSPVAFAYPGGHGHELETKRAVEAAGFLSARGHKVVKKPYIVSGNDKNPATGSRCRIS